MDRSYLFAPGHNAKLLDRVFTAGADALMLDLEDAVPPEYKAQARRMVAAALLSPPAPARAWVRVNAARAPGKPIICAIENARGVLAAQEIAAAPGVRHLAMGGVDLQRDLNTTGGNSQTLYVRSHLVICSRAAGIEPPIDSVFPRLDDDVELRSQAEFARSLGFFGKSAIHPRQLAVLHDVFTPSEQELAWAQEVLAAFDAAGGAALRLPDGEFVDLPVAQRARRVLQLADTVGAVGAVTVGV